MSELWTKENSIEILKRMVEEGSSASALNAIKLLNAMHGFSTLQKNREDDEKKDEKSEKIPTKHSIELIFIDKTRKKYEDNEE